MKKGQAEILGLVIIVLLLVFVMFFFLKMKQGDDSNVSLRSSYRVNNLLNAIVNLKYEKDDGSELKMKEMLKDCAIAMDKDSDECIAVDGIITGIFDETMLETEKYEFKANDEVISFEGVCEEGITASPVRFPGGYIFELKLCS